MVLRLSCLLCWMVCLAAWAMAQTFLLLPPRVEVQVREQKTFVVLEMEHPGNAAIPAKLELSWLEPNEERFGKRAQELLLQPGKNSFSVEHPMEFPSRWLRLQVRLAPLGERVFSPWEKVFALTEISAVPFVMRVSAVAVDEKARKVRVLATAAHPTTQKASEGVAWFASLRTAGALLEASRQSEPIPGMVEFEFDWDATSGSDDEKLGELRVEARIGDFRREIVQEVRARRERTVRIETQSDKELYQPGQTMHFRAVLLPTDGGAAGPRRLRMELKNPKGQRVLREERETSRFGVVACDWRIPESGASGEYRWQVEEVGDEDRGGALAVAERGVRVARYELPLFSVQVTAKKTILRPDEEAQISVAAKYLSGKAAAGGKVRVESVGAQGQVLAEGRANALGRFVARFRLPQGAAGQRFVDTKISVSYTDEQSGRTERQQLELRVSEKDLHLYVHAGAGEHMYVVVSSPTGDAAEATVAVEKDGAVVRAKTNRYGVARIWLPPTLRGESESGRELLVRAETADGRQAERREYLQQRRSLLSVWPRQTLLRRGQDIEVEIQNAVGAGWGVLEVLAGGQRFLQQFSGRGEKQSVRVAYREEFREGVRLRAWMAGSVRPATVSVVYLPEQSIRASVAAAQAVYKPGEKATLRFAVQDENGKGVPSAIGLAVVDEAVGQRLESMERAGLRRYGSPCWYCDEQAPAEIAGESLESLSERARKGALPEDLNLVAELLLWLKTQDHSQDRHEDEDDGAPTWRRIQEDSNALRDKIQRQGWEGMRTPRNEEELWRLYAEAGALFLQDPWQNPYRFRFGVEGDARWIALWSAGADGKFDSLDDVHGTHISFPYFADYGKILAACLQRQKVYPASARAFEELLRREGLEFLNLRDAWGSPYRLEIGVEREKRVIEVISAGLDRKPGSGDDVRVAHYAGPYFVREAEELDAVAAGAEKAWGTKQDWEAALAAAGVRWKEWRDPWGRQYELASVAADRWTNRYEMETGQTFGSAPTSFLAQSRLKAKYVFFNLRSKGADGRLGSGDDFSLWQTVMVQEEAEARKAAAAQADAGDAGLHGGVMDFSQAAIAAARMRLEGSDGSVREQQCDVSGRFAFSGLAPGVYKLIAESPGFQRYTLRAIPVRAGQKLEVEIILNVGLVSQVVSVEAAPPQIETASSVQAEDAKAATGVPARIMAATPRLREYFPETLLWLPELVSDAAGEAEVQFRLADSITKWQVRAFVSTEDGRWAHVETKIQAYQPFAIELDPPAQLTEGDEVEVPALLRDYTQRGRRRDVAIRFAPNSWSQVVGQGPGYVRLRAVRSAEEAPLEVSAVGNRQADAVRRTLRVVPGGYPQKKIELALLTGDTKLAFSIPANSIAASRRARLHVYPSYAALLLESVKGLVRIPAGCGEQVTSSAYANLVAYQMLQQAGPPFAALAQSALANVRRGVEQLEAYRQEDGGVAYFARGKSDAQVSAAALEFLAEASQATAVDSEWLEELAEYVARQQQQDAKRAALQAKALAAAKRAKVDLDDAALRKLLERYAQSEDAYIVAALLEAAVSARDPERGKVWAERLAALAKTRAGLVSWEMGTGSPFYSWGRTAEVEATGRALSALALWESSQGRNPAQLALARGAASFLLRSRGEFGIWFSTQATLRSVQGLTTFAGGLPQWGNREAALELRVNDKEISLSAAQSALDVVAVDVSEALREGENVLTLRGNGSVSLLLARVEADYTVPWERAELRKSDGMHLAWKCPKTTLVRGESVPCYLDVQRAVSEGGMLIAEVQLAPGLEVDKTALERQRRLLLSSYEVHPTKLVFYLWPNLQLTRVVVPLRARLAMKASSGLVRLYDYNNPDAAVEQGPETWTVRAPRASLPR